VHGRTIAADSHRHNPRAGATRDIGRSIGRPVVADHHFADDPVPPQKVVSLTDAFLEGGCLVQTWHHDRQLEWFAGRFHKRSIVASSKNPDGCRARIARLISRRNTAAAAPVNEYGEAPSRFVSVRPRV
jgi:hypothetical protein